MGEKQIQYLGEKSYNKGHKIPLNLGAEILQYYFNREMCMGVAMPPKI